MAGHFFFVPADDGRLVCVVIASEPGGGSVISGLSDEVVQHILNLRKVSGSLVSERPPLIPKTQTAPPYGSCADGNVVDRIRPCPTISGCMDSDKTNKSSCRLTLRTNPYVRTVTRCWGNYDIGNT